MKRHYHHRSWYLSKLSSDKLFITIFGSTPRLIIMMTSWVNGRLDPFSQRKRM